MLYKFLNAIGSGYSIGVVTYVKRFDQHFKPLITALEKYFPDVEKNYVLNGFYDPEIQAEYLKKARSFLRSTSAANVIAYSENQSLSKCWNQLILHAKKPKILIMNDDVSLFGLFRPCLESQIWLYDSAVINKSWSHFFISKNTVKRVGWFDERFPGVGMEDGDYGLRLAIAAGKKFEFDHHQHNIYCFGTTNKVAGNDDPGWKKFSANVNGKYTQANQDFYEKKWEISKQPLDNSIKLQELCYRIRPGMETPQFYDFALLDRPIKSPIN